MRARLCSRTALVWLVFVAAFINAGRTQAQYPTSLKHYWDFEDAVAGSTVALKDTAGVYVEGASAPAAESLSPLAAVATATGYSGYGDTAGYLKGVTNKTYQCYTSNLNSSKIGSTFTLESWYYYGSNGTNGWNKTYVGNNASLGLHQGNNTANVYVGGTVQTSAPAGYTNPIGQWVYQAIVADAAAGTVTFYELKLASKATASFAPLATTSSYKGNNGGLNFGLGDSERWYDGKYSGNGVFDKVALWGEVLSVSVLEDHYRNGLFLHTTPPIPAWNGSGKDGNWSTGANWSGSVPADNTEVGFGALTGLQAIPFNNAPGRTAAGVTYLAASANYALTGYGLSLTGAITNAGANDQAIFLPLSFATGSGSIDTGTKTLTLAGDLTGSVALTKTGTGTLILTGNNATTGGTNISAGTLQVGNGGASGGLGAGTVTINSGASLVLDRSDALTVANAIGGGGTLTQRGLGTTTLAAQNAYTGTTTVEAGTLALDFSAAAVTENVIASTSILRLAGGNLRVLGAASAANTQTFPSLAVLGGAGTISAAPGAGGSVTVNLGGLSRTAGGTVNIASGFTAKTAEVNGIAGILNGWMTYANADWATNDGSGNIVAYTDYTTLSGTMPNIVDGVATNVRINSASTGNIGLLPVAPATTVTINTLKQADANARTIDLADKTLRLGIQGGVLTTAGSGELTIGVAGPTAGRLTAGESDATAGELIFINHGPVTVNAPISDNVGGKVSLTKSGTGILSVAGGNTYTGPTYLNEGVLATDTLDNGGWQSGIGAAGSDPANLVFAGGTLHYTSTSLMAASTNRGFTLNGPGGTIRVDSTTGLTISGTAVGIGGLTKTGPGLLVLSNTANSYAGNTTIAEGTLTVGASGALPDGAGRGNVVLAPASGKMATLDLSSNSETINGLVSSGDGTSVVDNTYMFGSPTLTVGANGATSTFNGTIKNTYGTLALAKIGAGTLTLGGSNTYSGMTTVSGGILKLARAGALPANSNLKINGGILGLAAGDFLRPLGTDAGQVQWAAGNSGGFAAYGPVRSVSLGGYETPETVTWNNGGFVADGASLTLGTLDATHRIDFNNPINFAGAARTVDVRDGAAGVDARLSGKLTETSGSAGGLVKTGLGTLELTSTESDYTGGTTLKAGVLIVSDDRNLGASTGSLTFQGATLRVTGTTLTTTSRPVNWSDAGGTVEVVEPTLNFAMTGNIGAGAGPLTKLGPGTLKLTGTNSYSGNTNVEEGTLEFVAMANLGNPTTPATSEIRLGTETTAAMLKFTGTTTGTNRTVRLLGNGTIDASGSDPSEPFALNAATSVTGADRSLTLTGEGLGEVNGQILLGSGSLMKTGGGTWTVAGSNEYDGGTTVTAGTLMIAKAWSLPAGRSLTIGSGGTLVLGGGMVMGAAASTEPVPEPGTLALVAIAGLLGALALRARKAAK